MRKIIILQRFLEVGTTLRDSVRLQNPARANEVIVTDSTDHALKCLEEYPDALMLCSSCFGFTSIPDANAFVPIARRTAPNSILLIYSNLGDQMPPQADGLIAKYEVKLQDLTEMLCSFNEADTAETLQERFRFIIPCRPVAAQR